MKKLLVLASIFLISLFLIGCKALDNQRPTGLVTVPIDKIVVEGEISTEPIINESKEPKESDANKSIVENKPIEIIEESVPESEYYTLYINETQLVKPKLEAKDPDGDQVIYYFYSPLNSNGEWQTKIGDKGEYKTRVIASDGKSNTTLYLKIVVTKFNRAPILETIEDFTLNEGDTIILSPKAVDPDGDNVNISVTGWITSTKYKTNYNDGGTHSITISASDGIYATKQNVTITVNNVNRAPKIDKIDDIEVVEGDKVSVDIKFDDPDGDSITVKIDGPINQQGEWQTKIGDKGTYNVKIIASDRVSSSETSFKIIVNPKDSAPEFEQLKDIIVNEGERVEILAKANDPEGKELTYAINDKNFNQERNLFIWQTDYDDGGQEQVVYSIRITVSDGVNEVSQDIKVTVKDVNRAPVFKFG